VDASNSFGNGSSHPNVCSFCFPLQLSVPGSPTEIMYSLQTFGISPDQIPINSSSGTVKTQHHLKWMNMRQAMEEGRASGGPDSDFRGIDCPGHSDVLLGRGKPNSIHLGACALHPARTAYIPPLPSGTLRTYGAKFDCSRFFPSSRKLGHATCRQNQIGTIFQVQPQEGKGCHCFGSCGGNLSVWWAVSEGGKEWVVGGSGQGGGKG
jgi:hypothetical protein